VGAGIAAAGLPPLAAAAASTPPSSPWPRRAGAAVVVALLVREAPPGPGSVQATGSPAARPADPAAGRVSALLVVPQFAVVAFVVVYLVDEQGVGVASAALCSPIQFGGRAGSSRALVGPAGRGCAAARLAVRVSRLVRGRRRLAPDAARRCRCCLVPASSPSAGTAGLRRRRGDGRPGGPARPWVLQNTAVALGAR
jgi:hypothetical protein